MYKYILLCLLFLAPLSVNSTEAQLRALNPVKRTTAPYSNKETVISLVKETSQKYNIPFIIPLVIIESESRYNPLALNKNDGGKGCHSRGLVQINSCYHEVTDAQAYDINFSIEFLISNLAKGHCTWWTSCPIRGS